MVSFTESTRQPPAGGPGSASDPDELLRVLRRGERDGFVRYFRLFRAPVFGFALRLLHDEEAASAATVETLSAAFRRVILGEGASDLQVLTYRCAYDVCVARVEGSSGAASAASRPVEPDEHASRRRRASSDASRRFEVALESLELRQRAALLLHDVQGLGAARLAVVFSMTAEAAAALLFRAREEFRRALDELTARPQGHACRQAEQAAAGAVGLGLTGDERERLSRHAAYCRPCRKAMLSWPAGAFGLAVVLAQAPPPQALAAPPIFGGAAETAAAAGVGWLASVLRAPAGGVLRSKAAAYVIAVACLALASGLALREDTVRRFVLFESVGPAVQLVRAPDADAARPDRDRGGREASTQTSPAVARSSIGAQAGSQPLQTAAGGAVPVTSASDAPPAAEAAYGVAGQSRARDAAASSGSPKAARSGAAKRHKAKGSGHSAQRASSRHSSASQHRSKADKSHKTSKARRSTKVHRPGRTTRVHKAHKTTKAKKKDG